MRDEIRILTEAQLRAALPLDLDAVDVTERAFAALAAGGVVMPPILAMELPDRDAEIDVKTAYLPGFDGVALKVSTGFFQNPAKGLPSLGGLMAVFSAETGQVRAVLLDNGYLTDLRTAAAGAVAARWLAPERVETATVLGTGLQARLQMRAAHLVRLPSGPPRAQTPMSPVLPVRMPRGRTRRPRSTSPRPRWKIPNRPPSHRTIKHLFQGVIFKARA